MEALACALFLSSFCLCLYHFVFLSSSKQAFSFSSLRYFLNDQTWSDKACLLDLGKIFLIIFCIFYFTILQAVGDQGTSVSSDQAKKTFFTQYLHTAKLLFLLQGGLSCSCEGICILFPHTQLTHTTCTQTQICRLWALHCRQMKFSFSFFLAL